MGPQVQPKCFRHLNHMRNNWELRKRGSLIRFGHMEALLSKKKTLKGHFSRPAETDPYGVCLYVLMSKQRDWTGCSGWLLWVLVLVLRHLRCQKEGEDVFRSRPLWSIFSARSFNLVQGSINQRHQEEDNSSGGSWPTHVKEVVVNYVR